MAEIGNTFKVKKGLDVLGNTLMAGDLNVTGNLTVVTQTQTDNSTKAASTAYVKTAVANLVAASPAALDTLNELALALGNDANFSATVTANLATKATLDSPSLTGVPVAPTATAGSSTNQIATTAFVTTVNVLKAPLASPVLTGVPVAPTPAIDTNTTQLATTAFVVGQAATVAPLMDSVATIGVSKSYARQDHIHASDTTKANLSSPTFVGTLTAPYININRSNSVASGIQWYSTSYNAWTDYMALSGLSGQGPKGNLTPVGGSIVSSWARRSFIENAGGYGWIFESGTSGSTSPAIMAEISSVNGDARFLGQLTASQFNGGAVLTGTPTAPTAAPSTNSTQLANTAFVTNADNLKANIASPAFTGDATFTGGIGSSDFNVIPMPGGGRYTTNTVLVTGAFKITLPVLYTNTMMSFVVSVYEYNSSKSFDITISGYNYSPTASWFNTSVYMTGDIASKTPNVRFGNDGSKCCVWIGELSSTWDYPQIDIRNVRLGYGGQTASWLSGWVVAPVTTFDTIKAGPLAPSRSATVDSQIFTGVPSAPTAAALTNTTQLATTAFATAADNLKSNIASPSFTGIPVAPTAVAGTNTNQLATTQFVSTAVANLVAASPAALDTLNELALALGNDANFATTMTTNLATKAPLTSPTLSGVPVAPTASIDTNSTQLATTAFVINQAYIKTATAAATYAPLISPVITGTPTAPTAAALNDSTQIATTAFINSAMDATLTKTVSGAVDVTLTASEALNRVIILTGAITANINVLLPTLVGAWNIFNRTTGAFTVAIKMATGVGVGVAQSYSAAVISDGSNVVYAQTDYTNAYLAGVPTTTTAISTDNSSRIASTAFVKSLNLVSSSDIVDGGSF